MANTLAVTLSNVTLIAYVSIPEAHTYNMPLPDFFMGHPLFTNYAIPIAAVPSVPQAMEFLGHPLMPIPEVDPDGADDELDFNNDYGSQYLVMGML